MDESTNVIRSRECINSFISLARACAGGDGRGIAVAFERPKNKEFMIAHAYMKQDVKNMVWELSLQNYSHTSIENDVDAHVFGIAESDIMIYMKLRELANGKRVLVVSFHEAERALSFPYRKQRGVPQ